MEKIPTQEFKCCYSTCQNYYPDKQKHFVQFPETCLQFRQNIINESTDEHITHCKDCEKASKWVEACGKGLVKSIYEITKNLYICEKHFMGGKGPTKENPYPVPITGGDAEVTIENTDTNIIRDEVKIEVEEHLLDGIKEEKQQEESIGLKEQDQPQCPKQKTKKSRVSNKDKHNVDIEGLKEHQLVSRERNSINALLRIKFKNLPLAEQVKIKKIGRPTPALNLHQQDNVGGRTYTRHFSNNTYTQFKWIAGCDTVNALFCFPCVLLRSDKREKGWTLNGVTDLKHLKQRAVKHEISTQHIKSCMDLAFLGSVNIASHLNAAYRQGIIKHNEQVSKNRYILKRIINCIKFCGKLEIALRGHNEKESENLGVFREMIDFSSELDDVLKQHLSNATAFKGTTKTIQNEILDSMLAVCSQEIKDQIKQSDFLAIQIDETTDISNHSELVIIVRYLFENNIYEKFWSFLKVTDKSATGLTKVIEAELNSLIPDSPSKLIAQTYDGANVMSGLTGGVQAKIKETYKCAHFVHCYAHQLNLIIQKATSQNSKVKVFFSTLSGIAAFFSSSTHRSDILQEVVTRKLPGVDPTRWNYDIRIVNDVYENREKLIECFQELEEKCNRTDTCREAYVLRRDLEDPDFVFWLTLFHEIFPHIDILFNKFESISKGTIEMLKELKDFEKMMSLIGKSTDAIEQGVAETNLENKRRRVSTEYNNSTIAKEVCDTIIVQLKERLTYRGHLEAANLLNSENFSRYALNFPTSTLLTVTGFYPMLQPDKLKNELETIYSRKHFSKIEGCLNMLSLLSKHDLYETFSETVKLLKIIVTTPMSTDESERCFSTLKKIKTFLRNSLNNDRLNALAMLSVNKDLMHNISNFEERVIEHFIFVKDRSVDFLYKQ